MKGRVGPTGPHARAAFAAAVLVAFSVAGEAHASGFMLYDQSAEAMGKASAVVASAREPSAIWYNPAGLAFAPGYQASATGILYYVKSRFVQEGSGAQTQAEPALAPAGAFFAAGPVTRAVSVGIGAYSAFGLGLAWPEAWIGRENAIRSSLTTYTFNPSVALRLCDHLSLGAGFDVLRAVADQTNGLPAAVGGTVRVGGATWGYGANVGLLARVVPDRVHAAAAYRSRVSLSFDGRADFAPANQEFSRDLRDQGGTASATLPDILTAGLMVRTAQGVELAGEASLVRWSAYDKQVLVFEQAPQVVAEYNLRDVLIVRLGIDGPIGVRGLRLRTGWMYEQKPTRPEYLSPSLPDAHIFDLSTGAGFERRWWKVDAGYVIGLNWPTRALGGKEGPAGTYWTVSHAMALTLTARWGGGR